MAKGLSLSANPLTVLKKLGEAKTAEKRGRKKKDLSILGFANFDKVFPIAAYKESSLTTKRGILSNFAGYVAEQYPTAKHNYCVRMSFFRTWGLQLCADGFRKQSIVDYLGTARAYFEEGNRFCSEKRWDYKMQRTYRLCKLAAKKQAIEKADPVWGPDVEALQGKELALGIWLSSTGVRRASATKAKRTWSGRTKQGVDCTNVFVSDWKFLDSGESKIVQTFCGCTFCPPKVGMDDKHCLVCNPELNADFESLFPVKAKLFDAVTKKLDGTGHSWRRTLALGLRVLAEEDGLDIKDFMVKLNMHFKWSRFSVQVMSYSHDWEMYKEWKFPSCIRGVYETIKEKTKERMEKDFAALRKRIAKFEDEERPPFCIVGAMNDYGLEDGLDAMAETVLR